MRKLLRRIAIVLFILIVLLAGAGGWMYWRIQQETVTPLQTLNAEGSAGHALAVLNPGLSDFPGDVMTAFADGLAEQGWRIDRTTASTQATAEIGGYDLIVLVSPIYGSQVAPPLQAYLDRVGDFGGKRIAVVVTAGGDPKQAMANTEVLIEEHNGAVAGIYGYAVYEPNDRDNSYQGSNTERAVAMARDAARSLAGQLQ